MCAVMMIFYRMQMGAEPSVHTAANIFREICYNYRDQLTAGIIVAGWDKDNGGQVTTLSYMYKSTLYLLYLTPCIIISAMVFSG